MRASIRRGQLAALLLTVAGVASVAAAQAPGDGVAILAGGPRLTADRPVVQPGSALTVRASGFPGRAAVTLLAGPPHGATVRIGSATTGSRGGFVAKIRIRARSAARTLVASACIDGCRVRASVRFRIARS